VANSYNLLFLSSYRNSYENIQAGKPQVKCQTVTNFYD